jgi:septal ring factor EnvC (AmiA/AmiB activator)
LVARPSTLATLLLSSALLIWPSVPVGATGTMVEVAHHPPDLWAGIVAARAWQRERLTVPEDHQIRALLRSLRKDGLRQRAAAERTRDLARLHAALQRTDRALGPPPAALAASRAPDVAPAATITPTRPTVPALAPPPRPPTLPVDAVIRRSFGQDADRLRERGLVFAVDAALPVRAPGAGRVAYAGPFQGYGLLLIIEHEDEYHSLLSGFSQLLVGVEDVISAGQVVGRVGRTDGEAAEFYFELRHAGEPVDPLTSLAAGTGRIGD